MSPAIARLFATAAVALAPLVLSAQADSSADRTRPSKSATVVYDVPTLVTGTIHVQTLYDAGTYVALEDGTVWEVYLPDRTSSDEWQAGDVIQLRQRPIAQGAPTGTFDYEMVNGAARTTVAVRFAGTR